MAFKPVKDVPVQEIQESDQQFADLAEDIQRAHETGTSIEEAERLAAKFLSAQMSVAEELASLDLDARMKKNGLKATRAQVYMAACQASEKKPAEGWLENHVNMDIQVSAAQNRFDEADSRKETLSLYFGIFKDAHIYFRGIAKGRFE